jgi:hypothetical protein
VSRRNASLRAAAVVSVLAASAAAGHACGFEDPNGADAQRGLLNFAYPHALYVMTAVWRAQAAGVIARDELSPAARMLIGFQKAVGRLQALRDRMAASPGSSEAPAFAMVLVGPMLWTRVERAEEGLVMTTHVEGPKVGDVVIVTDEPVIAALADGRLTPQAAREGGLLRIYGPEVNAARLTAWLDGLSAQASVPAAGLTAN